MAKKVVKTKGKKKDNVALLITFLILGAFVLFIAVATVIQVKTMGPFCANSISCIKNLTGNKEATSKGEFNGKLVTAPEVNDKLAKESTNNVLGDSTPDQKHIYVDLSAQRLYAYDGNTKVYDFPVSTGKWNKTPTGDFRIWVWLRYTRMAGGSQALGTYYNLPNVPYTMYYSNASVPKSAGYSIHGAYWHNNFGHPMSHGCINMKIEDAGKIYYWTNPSAGNTSYPTAANPGTLITVYGTTPNE
jgi:lipoprotein-anchoring transpeptidase ErfK/SrfK